MDDVVDFQGRRRPLPAEAEGMSGRVRVDLEPLIRCRVVRLLQQCGAKVHSLFVGGGEILDVQVEVNLLRRPVRPLRPDMVRSELDAHPRLAIDENRVPVVVIGFDGSSDQLRPKGAHGPQFGRVQDNNRSRDLHHIIVCPAASAAQGLEFKSAGANRSVIVVPSGAPQ